MKNTKKALLALTCAVMLVVGSVMGTMAYLTSQTEVVTNTFTVGNVAITLDETDFDNSTEGKDRDTANAYHLMPGHEYTKDPIVHVASTSEDCYLFVKVTNEIEAIEDAATKVADQMDNKGWDVLDAEKGIYVYADAQGNPIKVSKNTNVTVFEKIKVAGTVDNTTLAGYANETITVQAYAVQADGFDGYTAAQIWTAAPLADWN